MLRSEDLEGQVASSQAELKQVSALLEQAKERALGEARAHIDEHKHAAEEAKAVWSRLRLSSRAGSA